MFLDVEFSPRSGMEEKAPATSWTLERGNEPRMEEAAWGWEGRVLGVLTVTSRADGLILRSVIPNIPPPQGLTLTL